MLNISGFYDSSCTNGYGWRCVVFLSGCPHKCKGCHNPETWLAGSGDDYSVRDLTEKVLVNRDYIEGITLSGGEPFQYENIDEILTFVHNIKKVGLTVWAYSGYLYEVLLADADYFRLLREVDVLIDGLYIEDLFDPGLLFKGSSNQRVIDVKSSLLSKKIINYSQK